ncbi:retinal rod rhodopsin-sensitive cGMP 3',5'-cyclic phosphodiesterase subunit gamma isoform X2 [Pipistrellus kuhlii]|uniref:retinal rod rhodopsin-sensitive cGMP 3',5'-cyclic phosphodiesterase subunit gamma isoform X2 n=1 Tax=Pipistrellus kuhlii TaxID=59472 RepID=UPI001E26FB89|nr:retinal rod rhodopsin-sensitive cGMP 3',5'-cyclic phosphodiesterase subunit gamma isoform X2 [Pipistrellus kuhlii]
MGQAAGDAVAERSRGRPGGGLGLPVLGLGTTSLEWKAWGQTSPSSARGRPSTTWSCTSWPSTASSSRTASGPRLPRPPQPGVRLRLKTFRGQRGQPPARPPEPGPHPLLHLEARAGAAVSAVSK